MTEPNTLLLLAGPSCAGKSPLVKALKTHHRELVAGFEEPVLYHTRDPRPGERDGTDYHFRTRKEVKALRDDDHVTVFKARDQLQAVDWREVDGLIEKGPVLYEGSVAIAQAFRDRYRARANVLDVFLAPLTLEEVRALRQASGFKRRLTEMNRRRLLRRTAGKTAHLSLPALQDVEERAGTIANELEEAPTFSYVIANHDGEDSDHWTLFTEPVGDARRALRALASILRGAPNGDVECWPADLFKKG